MLDRNQPWHRAQIIFASIFIPIAALMFGFLTSLLTTNSIADRYGLVLPFESYQSAMQRDPALSEIGAALWPICSLIWGALLLAWFRFAWSPWRSE